MKTWWLDLKFAVRSLLAAPAFTGVAVATLGIGIGANTALFSIVNGVLLQPLPYADADRLMVIWNDLGDGAQSLPAVNRLDYRDYQRMSQRFEQFSAAAGPGAVGLSGILTDDGRPELVDLAPVSASFFPMLGVDPALGRHFREEEEALRGARVALLSHEIWQRRFAGDPAALGSFFEVDGQSFEVVGILPQGFRLLLPPEAFQLRHAEVWTPLQIDYDQPRPRNFTGLSVFGKLKPGVSYAQAQAEMDSIAAQLRAIHPVHAASNLRIRAIPWHHDVVKAVKPSLLALLGAVAFVLLIVCANVANLMLVRGNTRRRDFALQQALGASRARLLRRLMTESGLLALAGGGLAVAIAWLGLTLLQTHRHGVLPRLAEVHLDGAALAFTFGLAALTALLFGLLPATAGTDSDLTKVLRDGGRATGGRGPLRARQFLVIGEIALSLVLLVGLGLMLRSFEALQKVHPGFEPEGVLTFRVELPRAQYRDAADRQTFFDRLERRLEALTGVEHVAWIAPQLPLTGSGPLQPYAYDEETSTRWESVTADGRWISPGYFEAMGTRLLGGRDFTDDDRDHYDDRPVVIIDQVVAQRAFGDQNPVGQRLQINPQDAEQPYAEVIGWVEHVRAHDLADQGLGQIYRPWRAGTQASLAIRTSVSEASLIPLAEKMLASLDPNLPATEVRPLTALVRGATLDRQFSLLLLAAFGLLAILLVALGLYGVVSHSVGQRRREFAIRIALGETNFNLHRRVLREGLRLALWATLAGTLAALVLGRYLSSLLYQVDARDPLTLATAAAFLILVALAACYLPARAATRVEPSQILRSE